MSAKNHFLPISSFSLFSFLLYSIVSPSKSLKYSVILTNALFSTLVNAAEQFFVEKNGDPYIVAGYPWFTFRGRDALLSLPGATLSVGNIDRFERMFATMTKMSADYISGNDYSTDYIETYVPNCPLWFMWNIQQYAIYTSVEQAAAKYGRLMLEVIDFIEKQKHPNLFVHDNGLLSLC